MNNRMVQKLGKNYTHFSKVQMWTLYMTFGKIIYDGLYQYRHTTRYGYPVTVANMEEWEKVLDELLYVFAEIKDDCPHNPYKIALKEWEKGHKKEDSLSFVKDANGRLVIDKTNEYFNITEDIGKEMESYNKRIDDGLKLFVTYYWDFNN